MPKAIANARADDVFNGFNTDYWQDGRTVELRITVYDSSPTCGRLIDQETNGGLLWPRM